MSKQLKTIFVLSTVFILCAITFVSAEKVQKNPQIIQMVAHDVSPALRDIPDVPSNTFAHKVHPVKQIPLPAGAIRPDVDGATTAPVQDVAGAALAPVAGIGFEGIDEATSPSCNCAPPDTNASVGGSYIVQTVNTTVAAWDKTGKLLMTPKKIQSLWTGNTAFHPCDQTNDGDPVVAYDEAADRWVISQFSVSSAPYYQCVAVSTSPDPTGAYYRYAYSYGNNFNDYPKIGVWPDAYYITYNMFTSTFIGSQVCAMDRANMLTGQPANQQCFQLSSSFGGLLPADQDGAAPPAGAPNYVLNFGSNKLNMWKFHVDWSNSANTTLTGPTAISTASFTAACNGGTCIPQAGTSNKLDSLADRLMYRLVYRNFTNHQSLLVNHSVFVSKSKGKEIDGVRWYELRPDGNGVFSVYQQGTYAPADGQSRWMGSIAMDKAGNIGLGYSASGPGNYPSIRYTGHANADALGTMGQGEAIMQDGRGSQTGTLHRWGDYSSLIVDPVDGCTFWYTTEYEAQSGSFNWSTRIGSFKVGTCP